MSGPVTRASGPRNRDRAQVRAAIQLARSGQAPLPGLVEQRNLPSRGGGVHSLRRELPELVAFELALERAGLQRTIAARARAGVARFMPVYVPLG